MKGKAHSPEVRAQVLAALLSGQGVTEVASAYGLNKCVVSKWKKTLDPQKLKQLETQKQDNLDTLILNYVCQNLKTLAAQSKEVGKPEYIKKQPASDLAVLHGVIADKTVRLLSAYQPTTGDQ